jgi:hypothetical protein
VAFVVAVLGRAVVLAGLPFGASPGIHVQPYLPFAAAIVLAEIYIPVTRR